jgi:hypothetical protein
MKRYIIGLAFLLALPLACQQPHGSSSGTSPASDSKVDAPHSPEKERLRERLSGKNQEVESELRKLLAAPGTTLSMEEFQGHLDAFGYEQWIDKEGFASYLMYEARYYDPSPAARVILFFYQDRLVAVLGHDSIEGYEHQESHRTSWSRTGGMPLSGRMRYFI